MENNTKIGPITRNAHWLAWVLAGLIILMMGVGLALQYVTESPFLGGPFLVHFSEVIGLSVFAVVGALIVSRHPRHLVGWTWLLISISFGVDHFAWGYAYYGYIAHPGSLPGPEIMIVWLYWLGRATLGLLGLTLLFLLFPTGKPLSPRWNVLVWIALGRVAIKAPLSAVRPDPVGYFPFPTDLLTAGGPVWVILEKYRTALDLVGLLCFLGALFSLFIRLIRARGVERQQLKWFGYTAAFLPPAFALIFLGGRMSSSGFSPVMLLGAFFGVTATLSMSAASAIAIFRYRLWDIDIIIRRTLVYFILTTTVVVFYLGLVILLEAAFRLLIGSGGQVARVVSTLVIYFLFNPLRRRVQDAIDRRFYRRKYNAEKIVAAFGAGLRQEVDIEQISQRLVEAVEETLQPESLSLWLKE